MADFADLIESAEEMTDTATMNISLTPQLEKLVQNRVKSGRYTSASEVISEALRLLETPDRALDTGAAPVRAEIDAGLRLLDDGKSSSFDEAAVERIKRRGRERLAELQSAKS